ncbi:MAG: hypothetical protein Q7N87_00010 [Candidatus Uhrbacteria bacterium]|nr:hypothetical protein [Candidatus Uhrbacteria bacterium]
MPMESFGRPNIDSRQVPAPQITGEAASAKKDQSVAWHPYHWDKEGVKQEIKLTDVAAPDPEMEFLDNAMTRYAVLAERLYRLSDEQAAQPTTEKTKEIQVLWGDLTEVKERIALGMRVLETKSSELQQERKFFMSREESFPEYSVSLEYLNFQLSRLAYLQERGASILALQNGERSDIDKSAVS